MEYRIIVIEDHHHSGASTDLRCASTVGAYDSAYAAVDEFRRALREGDEGVWNWHLVDDAGNVLFGPADLDAVLHDEPDLLPAA